MLGFQITSCNFSFISLSFFFFNLVIVLSLKALIPRAGSGGLGAMKQMCLMLLLSDNNRRKRERQMKALNFVPFQGYDVVMMDDGLAGKTCCTILPLSLYLGLL